MYLTLNSYSLPVGGSNNPVRIYKAAVGGRVRAAASYTEGTTVEKRRVQGGDKNSPFEEAWARRAYTRRNN